MEHGMHTQHTPKSILWFRKDLRIQDNLAVHHACSQGAFLPIFIVDASQISDLGKVSQWWLHQALQALNALLDNQLNIYQGDPKKVILKLAQKYHVTQIYFTAVFEPQLLKQDRDIIAYLEQHGITCTTFQSQLLWLPATTVKADKTPYKVFTPFYQNGCLQSVPPRKPIPAPTNMQIVFDQNNRTRINNVLLEQKDIAPQLQHHWNASPEGGYKKLQDFVKNKLETYQESRDFPALEGTSQLSAYLHFGQLSPHQIWHAVITSKAPARQIDAFLRQLGWREFSYNLLYHFPTLPEQNFQAKFDNFPWLANTPALHAWQQGKTGFPIIDAGMRQLLQTGYMHNRVRMIVASFLVKNLLLHWHHGRDWFWDTLVDADLANNSASWQWVAGSGVDAAPYFRIFNPVLQGEKFDKDGAYTRQFVPELAALPNKYIHKPWLAPQAILQNCNITLGKNYPHPIIDLDSSRKRALAAYQTL